MSEQAVAWGGATYERIAETFAPIHHRVVAALELRPGERVLDLACGTGGIALRAARAGAEAVGLDISSDQLGKARRAAAEEGLQARFDEGDCQELPYPDASFDAVASVFGLIFAPTHALAADEVTRVTRQGGRLALTAWPDDDWSRLGARLGREYPPGDNAREWGREQYVRSLLGELFDLRFEWGEWTVERGSADELWELCSTSVPPLKAWLESLDAERYEQARRAYLEFFTGGVVRRAYLLALGTRR